MIAGLGWESFGKLCPGTTTGRAWSMSPALRPGNIHLLESSSTQRRIFTSGATENPGFLILSIIEMLHPTRHQQWQGRSQVWLSSPCHCWQFRWEKIPGTLDYLLIIFDIKTFQTRRACFSLLRHPLCQLGQTEPSRLSWQVFDFKWSRQLQTFQFWLSDWRRNSFWSTIINKISSAIMTLTGSLKRPIFSNDFIYFGLGF